MIKCAMCGKNLKELRQKGVFKVEAHYNYDDKYFCQSCWQQDQIKKIYQYFAKKQKT